MMQKNLKSKVENHKMTYVTIVAIIILVVALYMFFEATWVEVSRIDFQTGAGGSSGGSAGGSTGGLKILHLTDMHIGFLLVSAAKTARVISKEDPDIIIITGDNIMSANKIPDFLAYMSKVIDGRRTIACLGNHDYKYFHNNPEGLAEYIRKMKEAGAEVMINSSVRLEKNGTLYDIAAIDDYREGNPDFEAILSKRQTVGSVPINIAITHNPDIVLKMPFKSFDYMFCGHFHGGQIWMPFHLEFLMFRNDILAKKGVRRGLNKVNGITLYLNRGLGNVVVPLRLFSRPEISVYRFIG